MPFAHKTTAAGQAGAAGLKEATTASGGRSRRPAFNPRTSLWRPAALGTALALGLAGLTAHAATLRLGNFDVQIDTTVSVGVQEAGQGTDYREHPQICFTTGDEFIYDTLAGRYMGLAMKSGRPANEVDVGLERLTLDYFTPANVRRLGR